MKHNMGKLFFIFVFTVLLSILSSQTIFWEEDFTFDPGNWLLESNWSIGSGCLRFHWYPTTENYEYTATSPITNTSLAEDLQILQWINYSGFVNEGFEIALLVDGIPDILWIHDDGTDWGAVGGEMLTLSLIPYQNQDVRLRFCSWGSSTWNINWWRIYYIAMETTYGDDLKALEITGPSYLNVGVPDTFTFTILNNGLNIQTNYSVKLMKEGGVELVSVPGVNIEPGEIQEYNLTWTPVEPGIANLYGVVILDGDEYPENNASGFLPVVITPPPPVGEGTVSNPYQIADLENLLWLTLRQTDWDKYYIQTADIDATDTIDWSAGSGWMPIGNETTHFTGSYNGQGYTIDGLFANRPDENLIGLFGWTQGASVENIGVTNVDFVGNNTAGSLVGWCDGSTKVINCYSTGSIQAGVNAGGLVGVMTSSKIINSFYNYNKVLINGKSMITIGALDDETYTNSFNNGLWLNIDDFLINDGIDYLLGSVDDFKKLLAFGQNPENSYRLTTDLDLSNSPDFYIPYFSGSFKGNGYVIENLNLNIGSHVSIGLFGYVYDAEIKDIGVIGADVTGHLYVGSLAGICFYSTISNSYGRGSVKGSWLIAGGLVGRSDSTTIEQSYFTGNVSAAWEVVGGLVGVSNDSTIENCYSMGNMESQAFTGGLAGYSSNSSFSNCFSSGKVVGDFYTGGLIGYENHSTVKTSYYNLEISGQSDTGKGEPRTTAAMTYPYEAETYEDWDFSLIWCADEDYSENDGYPYLKNISTAVSEEYAQEMTCTITMVIYPNPFNSSTTVRFSCTKEDELELVIYNVRGQRVKSVNNFESDKRECFFVWDSTDDNGIKVASGIYFVQTRANGTELRKAKMLLLK